ncbi:MAG: ParM/StbA family protein [Pseudomonadota bacterium]
MTENIKPTIIADDNGYADHKLCFWKGDPGKSEIVELSFPSRAAMGSQAMNVEGDLTGVYEVNDSRWTVGKNVHDPENTRVHGYAISDLNCVLVNHALIHAGFGGKKVMVATGLPYDDYYDEDGKKADFIEKVISSIGQEIKAFGEAEVAEIIENRIYPESTAAWVDFSVDSTTGETTAENEQGVAVVDIGGNTTDVTYLNGGNNRINKARSGTREIGVLHIRDKLRSLIKKNYDIDEISDSQLDKCLRTKSLTLFGKDNDVTDLVNKALNEVGHKVLNYVREKIGDGAQLDYIIFVGGGAEILRSVINEYPHAKIPERPQFSNARGMLKYWTLVTG